MELMNQFKAQTSSTIGAFLRQLGKRKKIDIQKCSFIQELNGMAGVYIVANDQEAMVLVVDALPDKDHEQVDERPCRREENLSPTHSNHHVSPIYLLRQVMSLLSLSYKKADLRNVKIGGAFLTNNSLVDVDLAQELFEQLNICVLDELAAKESTLKLREHDVEGSCTQQMLFDMRIHYDLLGLPDLINSEEKILTKGERKYAEKEERTKGKNADPLPPFSSDVSPKDIFIRFDEDDEDEDDEDEEDDLDLSDFEFGREDRKGEYSLEDFDNHMKEVKAALDEQYPSGPAGECNIPSRVHIIPPMDEPKEMFYQLVGFDDIRNQIETLTLMSKYARRRRMLDPNAKNHQITLHAVFTGNPGTGKSTVCKLYGALLREAGVLKYGHVVVVDRGSFIGNCWGDEEKSVRALLQLARGGVLMVDEAYQLLGEGHPSDPGRLVLPLMMNQLADPEWKDVAVVLCGYPQPMNRLISQNQGLESRFPNRFEFKDFDVKTLEQITLKHIGLYNYHFTPAAWAKYRWFLGEAYDRRDHTWANARFVTNWLERIYQWHGVRCERKNINSAEELSTLTEDDVREPDAPF